MDNSHKNSDVSDLNEKLYVDSYYRLLQCKEGNLSNPACIFRNLIRQSNAQCINLNMPPTSAEIFKSGLLTHYSNIIDNENYPGLLQVTEIKTGECSSIDDMKWNHCLKEFLEYLPDLTPKDICEIKAPKLTPTAVNVTPRDQLDSTSKTLTGKFKTFSQSKLNLASTSGLLPTQAKKRVATETPDSERFAKKYDKKGTYGKRAYVQPNVRQVSTKTSNISSSFMSASSVYRNPMNKSNGTNIVESKNNIEDDPHSELRNHETLKHFDKKIVDVILHEIMDFSPDVKWSDIAGLDFVKTTVQEIVIWPLLRPDIFTGLRAPPRGILLFGPPGTGKTLIGRCIATESNSTFFCISASSLASKWVGESEQLVRALFAAARLNQPAVIFIDEIDSLLSQRNDKEQDFTRKLKTEFLVQFDGAKTNSEERVLVVGATNRPHELDEAARRRFVKRLYVPLPDDSGRRQIIEKLLGAHQHEISEDGLQTICNKTKGYSGSDVAHLCKEAAMGPIRCIGPEKIKTVSLDEVRPIILDDFTDAIKQVRASVAQDDLNYYMEWNRKFGSFGV